MGVYMKVCPNCKNKIFFLKLLFLTNFNSIKCNNCGKKIIAETKINSVFGFISVIILTITFHLIIRFYNNFILALFISILEILILMFVYIKIIKLKIKS